MSRFIIPILGSIFKGEEPFTNMDSYKEVMSRLKFIGKVQKYEKINVKFMYVQPDGIGTTISRTISQDSRKNTLNFLQTVIYRSFEIIDKYSNSNLPTEISIKEHVLGDLKQAKIGLINLKGTYSSDIYFCCQVDTMLQDIDRKVNYSDVK